jgi:hypothetical protein
MEYPVFSLIQVLQPYMASKAQSHSNPQESRALAHRTYCSVGYP